MNALTGDDDNAGWNAFTNMFGLVHHFLCVRHIHRAWARKVREMYRGDTEADKLYTSLVVMMQEKSQTKFAEHVVAFRMKFSQKYPDFLKYLEAHYSQLTSGTTYLVCTWTWWTVKTLRN